MHGNSKELGFGMLKAPDGIFEEASKVKAMAVKVELDDGSG